MDISADELIAWISSNLETWDGEDLAKLFNSMGDEQVKYVGDSMFEEIESDTEVFGNLLGNINKLEE